MKRDRPDLNKNAIAEHIRKHGGVYEHIGQPLDGVAAFDGFMTLIELKKPKGAQWTRKQIQYLSTTQLPVLIATSGEEAMFKLRTRRTLTRTQQDALAALLVKNGKDIFTAKDVSTALGD